MRLSEPNLVPLEVVGVRTPAFPIAILQEIYSADVRTALFGILKSRADVRNSIAITSPTLGYAIDCWLAAGQSQDDGAFLPALAYVARLTSRPTPLGLCAALGRVELKTTNNVDIRCNDNVERRSYPNVSWLYGLAQEVENDPNLVEALRIRRSGLAYLVHGRLEVADLGRSLYGLSGEPLRPPVSIGVTPETAVSLSLCARKPNITVGELARSVSEVVGTPYSTVVNIVTALIRAGVFVTELRASPLCDVAHNLLDSLTRIGAPQATDIQRIITLLDQADRQPLTRLREFLDRHGLTGDMRWQVDSMRIYEGAIPLALADRVGATLVKLSAWTKINEDNSKIAMAVLRRVNEYHLVDLLRLLDPDDGLDLDAILEDDGARDEERSQYLLQLAVAALAEGVHEIRLDDLNPSFACEEVARDLPDSLEIVCGLIRSADGTIVPVLSYGALAGDAKTLARFTRFGEGGEPSRANDQTREEGFVECEMAFIPAGTRASNTVLRVRSAEKELACGVFGAVERATLTLDDLAVTAIGDRAYLWSRSADKPVRVRQPYALDATRFSRFTRFLWALGAVRRNTIAFHWGTHAERLQRTPRVTLDGAIVRLESWRVPNEVVGDQRRFEAWMKLWQIPTLVYLVFYDQRLLLDLSKTDCRAYVRDYAARSAENALLFEEAVPGFSDASVAGPAGGYLAEIAFSFRQRSREDPQLKLPKPMSVSASDRLMPPGSGWVYAKIYVGRVRADNLLERIVRPLVESTSGLWDRSFFIRYADPDHHIRLRVRARSEDLKSALMCEVADVLSVATLKGMTNRIEFCTYDREIERFGGIEAMDAAENVFTADSMLVFNLLGDTASAPPQAIAYIGSLASFVASTVGSVGLALDWLQRVFGRRGKLDASLWNAIKAARPLFGGFLCKCDALAESTNRYLALVPNERRDEALRLLLHLHANRLGIDALDENVMVMAARALVDSVAHSRKDATT